MSCSLENTLRNNSIEILRILFTFSIIIFHIFSAIDPKMQNIFFARHARIVVEFFYIMSGFFLYKTFRKNQNFKEIIINKFFRLFPIVFVIAIFTAIYQHRNLSDIIPDLFLLSSIGLANKSAINGYTWFIYPLFWISSLYLSMMIMIKDKFKFNFINIILIYFSLAIVSDYNITFSYTTYNILNVFNSGMLRAIAGIGLGVLFAMNLNNLPITSSPKKQQLIGLFELFLFVYLFAQLLFVPANHVIKSSLTLIIIFSLLFISFINKSVFFSKTLDKIKVYSISRYCYSWYVAQCVSYTILSRDVFSYIYFFNNHSDNRNSALSLNRSSC